MHLFLLFILSLSHLGIWPFDKSAMSEKVSRKHAKTSIINDLSVSTIDSSQSPTNTNSSSTVTLSNSQSINIDNSSDSYCLGQSSIQSNTMNSSSRTSTVDKHASNAQPIALNESSTNTTNQNSRNDSSDSSSQFNDHVHQSNQISETDLSTVFVAGGLSRDHLQLQQTRSLSPTQQVVIDDLITPPQSNDSSIVQHDSSSASLTNQQTKMITTQQLSQNTERLKKDNQSKVDGKGMKILILFSVLFITYCLSVIPTVDSKSPVAAVRQVVQEVLSQHHHQMQRAAAVNKPIRGSRLRSTIGLNITEDEFVLKKLEERETTNKKKKRGTQMNSNESIHQQPNRKKRKGATPTNMIMNDKQATKDIDLDLAIQALQTVIDHIDEDVLSDCFSDEF